MHCHILPGVDDGPATMDESLRVIKESWRQGVRCMIATPHYHPGRYVVDSKQVLEKVQAVREACQKREIPIWILPGQECYWFSGLMDALHDGHALTLNRTSFVLVEFEPDVLYSILQHAVRSLKSNGFQPLIAHFERYGCLYGRQDRLEELRREGAFFQLNYDRLLDRDSLFHRNPWRRLFLQGYVDYLGSDTHGMEFRPPHIDRALEWIEEQVPEELCWEILVRNTTWLTSGA